jgi:hypothetical protein
VESIAISVVEVDPAGILRLRPNIRVDENYEHIYRTASAVRWLREERMLTTVSLQGWPQSRCFRQILEAVRSEYGHILKLTPDTQWVNVSSEDRETIVDAANETAV